MFWLLIFSTPAWTAVIDLLNLTHLFFISFAYKGDALSVEIFFCLFLELVYSWISGLRLKGWELSPF